jgi:hypothetical protein
MDSLQSRVRFRIRRSNRVQSTSRVISARVLKSSTATDCHIRFRFRFHNRPDQHYVGGGGGGGGGGLRLRVTATNMHSLEGGGKDQGREVMLQVASEWTRWWCLSCPLPFTYVHRVMSEALPDIHPHIRSPSSVFRLPFSVL